MAQKNIVVFGGAFSPPTLAHEAIITACLSMPQFDQVWLLPSGDRDDKLVALSDADRLAMLQVLRSEQFGDNPRLVVSDFELALPRPTKTYRTVRALQTAYKDLQFWFAFGADSYQDMPNWEHGRELKEQLSVLLFERTTSISSTRVRQALAAGKSLDGLVSPPIERFLLGQKERAAP